MLYGHEILDAKCMNVPKIAGKFSSS